MHFFAILQKITLRLRGRPGKLEIQLTYQKKINSFRRCRHVRVKVTLACTECKQRNYSTKKNKKNDPDRIEMNKHCKFCRKHTLHRETK